MSKHHVTSVIREALSADYPALVPIADEVHALHAGAHPSIFRSVGSGSSLPRAYFDELLAGDASTIQVAEVEDIIVGFAIVNIFDAPPFEVLVPRRTVFIDSMVVTKAQRGKGIGRALVDVASAWGRARGATTLELTVWEFNRAAMAFYEGLGLATIHRTMKLEL
jgi:GNAT superfamily N-acetyltransferase